MKSPSKDIILQVDSLNTFYGKAQILFNMSLKIRRSEVVVLLGRNGAGKTTTFKSIMGIVPPRNGKIRFKGHSIQDMPSYKICLMGLGYVPEDRRIFTGLTIMENLEVGRQPPRKGFAPWNPERLFGLFPNLAEMKNRLGGQISGGEQQMLTIARTLMGNPEMIILDEPSEGLAPFIVDHLAETIQKLKEEGVSILSAEQNLNFTRRICDRAHIVDQGSIIFESPIEELSDDVCDKYLVV